MCGARLFAVRVILLQRYKVWPARPPDFGSLPTLIQGARNGRQRNLRRFKLLVCSTGHAAPWVEASTGRPAALESRVDG